MGSVLITGANRGLGFELQKIYYEKSYTTFPVVRTDEAAEHLRNLFHLNAIRSLRI